MIEVVSPTSVAAPCRLEETAIHRTMATGEIFSFLQMASATGATITTVATLSMKAEIRPANRDIYMVTIMTLGALSSRRSAIRSGILESMK